MNALVLSAGAGRRLWEYSRRPKCLLEIGGMPLIHRYLDALHAITPRLREIVLVVGYQAQDVREVVRRHPLANRVRYVDNDRYELGSVVSLEVGLGEGGDKTLLMDGDVYFEPPVLERLLDSPGSDVFLVDTRSRNTGEEIMVGADAGRVVRVGRGMDGQFETYGEWIGFLKLSGRASGELARLARSSVERGIVSVGYEDLLDALARRVPCGVCLVDGLRWIEIDFPSDVEAAKRLAAASDSGSRS